MVSFGPLKQVIESGCIIGLYDVVLKTGKKKVKSQSEIICILFRISFCLLSTLYSA